VALALLLALRSGPARHKDWLAGPLSWLYWLLRRRPAAPPPVPAERAVCSVQS